MSNVFAIKKDFPRCGLKGIAEHVEKGGFSGAIRTDYGMYRMFPNLQVNIIHSYQCTEFFTQLFCFQNNGTVHVFLAVKKVDF
jgi:hypothetical protein